MKRRSTTTDGQQYARWGIPALCAAVLAASYWAMPDAASTEDHIGYMLRVTARVAFVFLVGAYIARPLTRLFGIGGSLLANRRYLGLAMALAHTVHFGYVATFVVVLEQPVDPVTYVFGGLAFLVMWAMAATSNDAAMRLLKRNWKRLHTFGQHYLWLIFMQSFVGAIAVSDWPWLYAGLSSLGMVALVLRIVAWRRSRAGAPGSDTAQTVPN